MDDLSNDTGEEDRLVSNFPSKDIYPPSIPSKVDSEICSGRSERSNQPAKLSSGMGSHLNGSILPSQAHHIAIEEIAPSMSSTCRQSKESWQLSLNMFTSKKHGIDKTLPRRIQRFYKRQDELIDAFEEIQLEVDDAMEITENQLIKLKKAGKMAAITLAANVILLIAKSVAACLSGSLAVISAVIDSVMDLFSGALMWWSSRAMKTRDPYLYPQGRTKLEPVSVVILSVMMALLSVNVIRESIDKIISNSSGPVMGLATMLICVFTVVVKFVLYILCRKIAVPATQALAQDHRNDCLSNSVALLAGYLGDKVWMYADPVGAILISLYIIVTWAKTGWEQTKMLTGLTANPDFLKRITWIALNHHHKIKWIDTVRAFHFGNNFLVEVDIVLPEDMSLKQAHDIGESLQIKIETLVEVERAFVHLDYEWEHDPKSEHKQV